MVLGSRWFGSDDDVHGAHQPQAALPGLGPGQGVTVRLDVVAPRVDADLSLVVDLLDEGNRKFDPPKAESVRVAVRIHLPRSGWSSSGTARDAFARWRSST